MALRAALYMRVSDDQDGRSRSVSQQAEAVRLACERAGWRVAASFEEPDRSASRFAKRDRPEWDRLMDGLRAGRFDVVVMYEPSRGDRKLTGWSQFLDECRERSVLIHVTSHSHTYDLSNPRDWRALAEDGLDAVWESEKTSIRIRRAMADNAERGKPHGRLPYGFKRQRDPDTGKLTREPHPEEAPIVREIMERIAGGDSIRSLINDLNARNGKVWARSSICRMVLEGAVYIGKRRYDGKMLDGNWPPLVDEDVYWRAVAVLSDPARKSMANGRGGIRPGAAKWLLSYIGSCAKCGAPLSVTTREYANGPTAMYRCSSSAGGCAYAPVEWVDFAASEAIIKWASRPGIYEAIMTPDDRESAALRDELDAERARLAEFEQQAIDGKISADSYARIAAGIETRIADLERAERSANSPAALRDLLAAGSREDNVRGCWAGMSLTARRHVVSVLVASPGYLRLEPVGGREALDWRRIALRFADDPRA